jgi:branched-chain amino acid aminotransferase
MIKLFTLSPDAQETRLPDMSSLDAISRQLPQGLFSTFRTFAGCEKVLDLELHLRRLYDPLGALAVNPDVSALELRTALRELLKDFAPGEARVRISLSTAESPGRVFVMLEPLKLLDETVYQRGVRVVLSHAERQNPRLKTTSFIGKSDGERKSILKSGIFEALMVHRDRILEGLTSNFYAVRAGKIITARDGILLGVTRRTVLRLARANGIGIEYRPLRVDELPLIDEAFITSSSRGVVPVVEIEGHPVGAGQMGEVARLLRRAYDVYVLRAADRI